MGEYKVHKYDLPPGDDLIITAGDPAYLIRRSTPDPREVMRVSNYSGDPKPLDPPGTEPPPDPDPDPNPVPPPSGANMVPNSLLQTSHLPWVSLKGYILNCEKRPATCGLHGALLPGDPRVPFPSPTGTRYLEADYDPEAAHFQIWPPPSEQPNDLAWCEFASTGYDPEKGLTFGYEECGHIRETQPNDIYHGKMAVRLKGKVSAGAPWELLKENTAMKTFGAGKTLPPATISQLVPTGKVYAFFRLEVEAWLLSTASNANPGVLWGAFVLKAA